MPVRAPRSKFVLGLERRLGRSLLDEEIRRLAAYACALKVRRVQQQQQQQQRVYKPRMELWDDGESARVTAVFELPGMRPDEIAVDVVDGWLVVSGERRPQQQQQRSSTTATMSPTASTTAMCLRGGTAGQTGALVREVKYGAFRRVVGVPAGCTTSDLEAAIENGMLTVSWPREPHARISGGISASVRAVDGEPCVEGG